MDKSNSDIPEYVLEEANEASRALLQEKSRERYGKEYSAFKQRMGQWLVRWIKDDDDAKV